MKQLFLNLLRLVFCVLVCLCCSTTAMAQEKTLLIEGTYAGSETGDFNYLLLQTKNDTQSFFCNPFFTDILDAIKTKNPIVIEFYSKTQFVEGAGENIDMNIIKSIFIPDEYAPDYGIKISESHKP